MACVAASCDFTGRQTHERTGPSARPYIRDPCVEVHAPSTGCRSVRRPAQVRRLADRSRDRKGGDSMEALTTMTAVATSREPTRDVSIPEASTRPRVLRVKATYLLSEKGRKAALLAGRSGRERQRVKVPVPSHRLHLVAVDPDGIPRLKLLPRYELRQARVVRIDALPVFDHPLTPDELLLVAAKNHELEQAWYAQRVSRSGHIAEAVNRREDMAQAFLTDRRQRALEHPTPNAAWCYLRVDGGRIMFDVTKGSPLSRKVPPEAHRRFEAGLRARRRRDQQRRAGGGGDHEEKQQILGNWMLGYRTPHPPARPPAGLL